jgi:DNA-binding response OmpR family regulator
MAKILVIDDEQMLRRTLRALLERAGHLVVEAEDGNQGLAQFDLQKPDLVLTDIIMPDREGVETIGEMLRRAPETPIIAMSGGGSRGGDLFLTLAKQLGASATLTKPIRQAELIAAVDAALQPAAGGYDARAAAR